MRAICFCAALGVLFAVAAPAPAAEIWVDQAGGAAEPDGTASAPFKTVADAVNAATGPGDAVVIKAGTYRERIARLPAGQEGRPFTLKAASGERVVLTGSVLVTGWQKHDANVWVATVATEPKRLLLNRRELPAARHPNEGWWVASSVGDDAVTDAEHLTSLTTDPAGATAYVWTQKGNTFVERAVASLDRSAGTLALAPPAKKVPALTAGDKYYLKNHPAFVDRPGEWAAVPNGADGFKLYFRPAAEADLGAVELPTGAGPVISASGTRHVVIDGLEIAAGLRNGVEVHQSLHVTILNCVVHNHDYSGINVRDAEDVTIRRTVVVRNEYGVLVGSTKRALVEECEIGWNGTDGMVFSWNSDDVRLHRSYVHDHMLWGHPDNVQLYRGVTNFRMTDNLLQTAGQSLMAEEVTGGEISGNMVIGCGANMLIFGHSNAGDFTIRNNTLAFPGYSCMSLTHRDYRVHDNVFVTGGGAIAYGVKGVEGYVGDRNLFWTGERAAGRGRILNSDAGWHATVDAFAEATGQDRHSVLTDPRFRNAPIGDGVLDGKRLADCTRERLFVRGAADGFAVGDNVEVNYDGVHRKVTAVDAESITIDPPLRELPTKGWLLANWGDNSDYTLDLRLSDDSPGRTMGEGGRPVGSSIDVQAYRRGDFDADGTRDLPPVPEELVAPEPF